MKLLKQILELSQPKPEVVVEEIVNEKWVEVDGQTLSIGPFHVYLSGYSLTAKGMIDEVVLRVFNKETHQSYKVEVNPATEINPQDVDSGLRGLEYTIWDLTNKPSGTVVTDEETVEFISSLAYKFMVREFDEAVNPDNSDYDPSDDTYAQRRDKMRQAADARAELDLGNDY